MKMTDEQTPVPTLWMTDEELQGVITEFVQHGYRPSAGKPTIRTATFVIDQTQLVFVVKRIPPEPAEKSEAEKLADEVLEHRPDDRTKVS